MTWGNARDITASSKPPPFPGRNIKSISRNEIKSVLDSAPKFWDNSVTRVARLTDDTVVKYGWDVDISEARNMSFVLEHTTIATPKLYDFWEEQPDTRPLGYEDGAKVCYIVMQFIEGPLLFDVLDESNETQKSDVNKQLTTYVTELSKLKVETPGPIGGGVSNGEFFTDYGAGPFTSTEDLELWFNERLLLCKQVRRVREDHADFTGRLRPLVMCHMDLHLQNMVLDNEGKLWILDWGCAGGYPAHFEVGTIISRGVSAPYFKQMLKALGAHKHEDDIDRLYKIGFALTTGAFCKPVVRQSEKS